MIHQVWLHSIPGAMCRAVVDGEIIDVTGTNAMDDFHL
jgi:hypothetical protein